MAAKILLADDSITIQKIFHQTFEHEPVEMALVGNGEAAIRKLQEFRPDLVLADIFMPGKNGYEVCEYVKQQPELASIPVILLVGAFEPFDISESTRVGADGHLTKPFAPKLLSETVRKYLPPDAFEHEGPVLAPILNEVGEQATPSETSPLSSASSKEEEELETPLEISHVVESPILTEETVAEPAPLMIESTPEEPIAVPVPEVDEANVLSKEFAEFKRSMELESPRGVVREEYGPIRPFSTTPPAEEVLPSPKPVEQEKAPATMEELMGVAPPLIATAEESVLTTAQMPSSAAAENKIAPGLSDATIDAIARRVIEKMSSQAVEHVAWEVVPEMAETLLRRIIAEKK